MTATRTADPDLNSPQTAGPRFVVELDGNATWGVYDYRWDEMISGGWSYAEAATLRNDYNTRALGLGPGREWW